MQALGVAQLLFALPLGAVFTRRRPLRRDWCGYAAVRAGLAVLVSRYGGVRPSSGHRSHVCLVVVAAVLVTLLPAGARLLRSRPQARPVAIAVAAGVCFAMTAVFVVFAGDDVSRYGLPGAPSRCVPARCGSARDRVYGTPGRSPPARCADRPRSGV